MLSRGLITRVFKIKILENKLRFWSTDFSDKVNMISMTSFPISPTVFNAKYEKSIKIYFFKEKKLEKRQFLPISSLEKMAKILNF